MSYRTHGPTSGGFSIPRARLREKFRPEHIRQRLQHMKLIGPGRMPLPERVRLVRSQLAQGVRLVAEAVRPPVDFERLFLVGHPRGGTGWVGTLLGGHPDIAWGGELWMPFNPRGLPIALMPKSVSAWHLERNLRWQARQRRCRYSASKLLVSHIASRHFELDEIERLWPDARVIVLVRRHLGLQYVSHETAALTDQFALVDEAERRTATPTIDLADFRHWCASALHQYRALASQAIGQRALWLVYEELDGNPAPAFEAAVWPYLDLPPSPLVSSFRKQRIRALAERITNYDEVGAELEAAILEVATPDGSGYSDGPPPGLLASSATG